MNLRSLPLLHWLRHTGVPLARPSILLVTLTALLITTLGYLGFLSTDDGLLKHLPDLTSEGRAMVRHQGVQHGIFITCLLLAGLFCLARGMRFSRRLWLLLLIIVGLGDLWRVMPVPKRLRYFMQRDGAVVCVLVRVSTTDSSKVSGSLADDPPWHTRKRHH